MHVAELWRYPVKSLAGERLEEAELKADGITGDRLFRVRRSDGRIVDARAHQRLLALHPQLSSAGELLFDDEPWDAPEIARAVEEAAAVGSGAHLVRNDERIASTCCHCWWLPTAQLLLLAATGGGSVRTSC